MKHIVWVILVFTGINLASAQDVYTSSGKPGYHKKVVKKKTGYDPDKLILGGGLSLDFGTDWIVAGVSPIIGYRITDQFSAGLGVGYLYFKLPDYDMSTTYTTVYKKGNLIYPNVWARYFVYRNIFLTCNFEYDIISGNYPGFDYNSNQYYTIKESISAQSLLFGIGMKQPIGGRVSMFGQIQHEVLGQPNSPYAGQPLIFNAGVCAGL